MGWNKREAVTDLTILGDEDGHVTKAAGLLASIKPDRTYPDNSNYELVQKSGESITLAGAASLNRQISPEDIGKFIKAEFTGWGKAGKNSYKIIEVMIWDGEPTPDMLKWPRYQELQPAKGPGAWDKAPKPLEKALAGEKNDDDDLPF